MDEQQVHKCDSCDKTFNLRQNLLRHMKKAHILINVSNKRKYNIKCPAISCEETFPTRKRLREHVTSAHNVVMDVEHKEFSSFQEFEQWKMELEKEIYCSYVLRQAPTTLVTKMKTYYFTCFRSGKYNSRSIGKRGIKSTRSRQISGCCPSTMDVIIDLDGKTTVIYWKTHFGHECEKKHLFLSSTERLDIASMNEQKTAASLREFLCVLQEHEVQTYSKFVCIESQRVFTEENFKPNEKMKIHWDNGEPYYYVGCRVYACHKGKDKNLSQKKKYAEKRDAKACEDHEFTQRRNLAQPTKKLDCPVVIKVTRVLSLPKFKVDKTTKWKKDKMAELIRKKVRDGEDISGENRYCFTLPAEDSHKNHVQNEVFQMYESIVNVKNSEVNNPDQDSGSDQDDQNQYEEPAEEDYSGSDLLKTRESKQNKDIAECNSIIRTLQSTMWLLNEEYLETLKTDLRNILNEASLHVSTDKDTSLPLETKSSKDSTEHKRHLSEYAELPKPAKKKIKHFGQAADAKKLQIKVLPK